MDFTAVCHFAISHIDQLLEKIKLWQPNSDSNDVCELNGTTHEDFRTEKNLSP